MRPWSLIVLGISTACGPMYGTGNPPPSPPPQAAPPGAAEPGAVAVGPAEPDSVDPGDPTGPSSPPGAPADPYGGAASQVDVEPAAHKRAPAGARTKLSADAQAFVDAHNRLRARHCAKPLTWSPRLEQIAQRWANSLRDQGCKFGHSNGSTGENLAAGTIGTLPPGAVVQMWYDEIAQYKFPNGGFSMGTGHFTQVVWRGTAQVGCGHAQCNRMDIWVCEYDPPGNWEGQYRENVLPTGCKQ